MAKRATAGARPVAEPVRIPAPWGGLNTRDGIATLQPQEARQLENWTPVGSTVSPRPGTTLFSDSSETDPVETLAAYDGMSGMALIGVAGGDIYDFSGATASSLSAAGYTDSRFQTECYNDRLIGVNGTDTPWVYNGSAIAATGFTGVTLTDLINIKKVRNRLWLVEKNSASAWYGGVGAVTGALTEFDVGQVVAGGYLVAVAAHSYDSGDGPDDMTVFIMSTGEVVIYTGDPSSTFSKIGNFKVPKPIGRQCTVNIGGQLAILTHMGLVPVQAAIQGTAFDLMALGNFGKVAPSIRDDAKRYSGLAGWTMVYWQGYVIINTPTLEDEVSKQYVFNTLTGAWTTWSRSLACLAVYDEQLVFGSWSAGDVYEFTGTTDSGTAIPLLARCAFNTHPQGKRLKATAIRFDIEVTGSLSGRFGLDTDYIPRPITIPVQTLTQSEESTPWGSPWGSEWSTSTTRKGEWLSTYGMGQALGLAFEGSTSASTLNWFACQILTQMSARR